MPLQSSYRCVSFNDRAELSKRACYGIHGFLGATLVIRDYPLLGTHCWRIALLIVSAFFVALIGPFRNYLGDVWASNILGAYLIGDVLLGIALWIYIKLKERIIMETKRARTRSNAYRFFDRK